MRTALRTGLTAALAAAGLSMSAASGAHKPAAAESAPAFSIETLAERRAAELPAGPLFWRIETFPAAADAERAMQRTSLMAQISGRTWLFTLTNAGEGQPRGSLVATIGPVPRFSARQYLLRVNRAGGPPGAATPVHMHPGSEAFHVLSGQLSQHTRHGTVRIDAGQSMNGHEPELPMRLTSSGSAPLDQIVLFLVDAERAFSVPAAF